MSVILNGLGIACAVFATGFLLAVGWHVGIIFAAWSFGPHRHEHNYNVRLPSGGDERTP